MSLVRRVCVTLSLLIAPGIVFAQSGPSSITVLGLAAQTLPAALPTEPVSGSTPASQPTTAEIADIQAHLQFIVYYTHYTDYAERRTEGTRYLRNMGRSGNEWTALHLTNFLAGTAPTTGERTFFARPSTQYGHAATVLQGLPRGRGREVAYFPLLNFMADGNGPWEARVTAGQVLAAWIQGANPRLPAGVEANVFVPVLTNVIHSRVDYRVRRQAIIIAGRIGPGAAAADARLVPELQGIRDSEGEDDLKEAVQEALAAIVPAPAQP